METKRFRRVLMGFNKNDVYEHIEGLYHSFDEQLKIKDEEIDSLQKQNLSLKEQLLKLEDRLLGIEDYKSNIADVLLKAKEQGEEIIKEAQREAEERKKEIEQYMEEQKEKLSIFKNDVMAIKQSIIELMSKYNQEIDNIIENLPDNQTK